MKLKLKRWSLCLLAAVLLLTAAGCGGEQQPAPADETPVFHKPVIEKPAETDYTQVYAEILESACALLLDADHHAATEGEKDVFVMSTSYGADALNCAGYYIQDISGDGIPELLIGNIPQYGNMLEYSNIFAVYTCVDGAPYLTFESGWYQSTYYYLEDGSFFNTGYETIGDNGDIGEWFASYDISPDGTELICNDFYFAYTKDEGGLGSGFYRNQSGLLDPDDSQELELSFEMFWQIYVVAVDQTQNLALTPFADLLPAGATSGPEDTPVRVQWAEDAGPLTDYEEYTVSSAEPQVRIVFTADGPVTGFSLLELTMESINDSGEVEFTATPALPQVSELLPGKPLVAGILFPENIPRYGFQYEDANGNIRRFALELSGEDGSLLIREADPAYYNFVLNSFGSAVE